MKFTYPLNIACYDPTVLNNLFIGELMLVLIAYCKFIYCDNKNPLLKSVERPSLLLNLGTYFKYPFFCSRSRLWFKDLSLYGCPLANLGTNTVTPVRQPVHFVFARWSVYPHCGLVYYVLCIIPKRSHNLARIVFHTVCHPDKARTKVVLCSKNHKARVSRLTISKWKWPGYWINGCEIKDKWYNVMNYYVPTHWWKDIE